MDSFLLVVSLAMGVLVLCSLYRGAYGPTVLDRIMGIGFIGTKTTMLLVLIGMIYKRVDMFVDIALAYALLNFIATLAAAKFFRLTKNPAPNAQPVHDRKENK